MALMRRQDIWDPIRDLEEIGSRFNRLLGFPRLGGAMERDDLAITAWAPSCDILETDSEYRIRLELPNVKKEDVHITLDQGMLTVQGERKEEKEEESGRFHRRELEYGSFLRRFTLPDDVDSEKVDAKFHDGMLTVAVPKTQTKQTKAREIAIH